MKFVSIKFLTIFIVIVLLALILFFKLVWLGNEIQVAPLQLEDSVINFPYSDENNKESLIIKSDQEHYTGDTGSDAYFSVTNISKIDESAILLFYFPGQFIPNRNDPPGTQPATVTFLEQREGDSWRRMEFFSKNIKINDDLLGPAIIKRKSIPEDFEIKAGTQIEVKAGQTVYFKSRISFRPTDSGEFWIEALGKNGGYGLLDPTYTGTRYGSKTSTDTAPAWFASGSLDWTHRKKITVDYKKVSGGSDLSNFPVLFSVIDSTLATTANGGKAASGSGEFVFTSSDGTTVLPHEIERYSATTGEFIGWINVTTLSATNNTNLYIYYGGPAAGTKTNQRKAETWNSAYKGVWHLSNGTTLSALDSTSGANNGTVSGTIAGTGKIDGAGNFDGTDDDINIGDKITDALTTMTICAWVNHDTITSDDAMLAKRNATTAVGFIFFRDDVGNGGNDLYSFFVQETAAAGGTNTRVESAGGSSPISRWSHICGSMTLNNANGLNMYINGLKTSTSPVTTSGITDIDATTQALLIGDDDQTARPFDGQIDEVKISNSVRAEGWIVTEFNNQSSPSTFYSLGGLEAKTPSGPGLKIKGGVKIK